jgi:hypothetical protein
MVAGLSTRGDFHPRKSTSCEAHISKIHSLNPISELLFNRLESFQTLQSIFIDPLLSIAIAHDAGEGWADQTTTILLDGYRLANYYSSQKNPCCDLSATMVVSECCPSSAPRPIAIGISNLTVGGLKVQFDLGDGRECFCDWIIQAANCALVDRNYELVDALLTHWLFLSVQLNSLYVHRIEHFLAAGGERLVYLRRMATRFAALAEDLGAHVKSDLDRLVGRSVQSNSIDRAKHLKSVGRSYLLRRLGENALRLDGHLRDSLCEWASKHWLLLSPDSIGAFSVKNHASLTVELAGILEQFLRERVASLSRHAAAQLDLRPGRVGLGDVCQAYGKRVERTCPSFNEIKKVFAGYPVTVEKFQRVVSLRNQAAHGSVGRDELEEICDCILGSYLRGKDEEPGIISGFLQGA